MVALFLQRFVRLESHTMTVLGNGLPVCPRLATQREEDRRRCAGWRGTVANRDQSRVRQVVSTEKPSYVSFFALEEELRRATGFCLWDDRIGSTEESLLLRGRADSSVE